MYRSKSQFTLGYGLAQPEPFAIHFPQRCILHVPGQRSVPLALMFFMAWKVPVVVREVSRMPPETRKTKLSYADFLTGETTEVDADEIDIGFDTVLEPGGFYRNIRGWVYVCEHVEAGSAHLVLLDSLQHGRIIVVRCTTEQKYQTKYVPITDEEELREWEERYKSFLQAAGPFEKPAA